MAGSNAEPRPRGMTAKVLGQQGWGLSATAIGAGAYGLLVWIVGAYVFSTWSLDGPQDNAPLVDLARTFTYLNVLWGVALLVDLLNGLWTKGRKKVRVIGTLFAIGLVVMAQMALSKMSLAAGG